jgi:hypothetical protein
VASPLLANVYLHYLFDLWADVWRRKVARGDVIIVLYADDLVVGFQHRTDAERFLKGYRYKEQEIDDTLEHWLFSGREEEVDGIDNPLRGWLRTVGTR